MSATLFYLVRNPAALHKASDEVRRTFGDVEEIHQGPELSSCVYLRACIDEAMRMSPSVGGILPREVLSGGITVDGEFIPAGTVIGTSHYTIHHNPAYHPEPFSYIPERWIVGSEKVSSGYPKGIVTEEDVALAQTAFSPFSVGPRGCIGKGLAYVEMMTTLARTLYLYDLRKAAGPDPAEGRPGLEYGRHRVEEYQLIDQFTSLKDGPMVEFRKRM
jgi:cytochrome P450